MPETTRVTIVAGFLGAGKTSVIRHLLSTEQNETSRFILVNEIGKLGIDGDIIANSAGECQVREMVGGCICCTAQIAFRTTVVEMLRKKPQHLIVEPTGLAAVGDVLAVFAEEGIAPSVHLDPTLVVMDPRHWAQERIREHDLYREQRAHTDVIVITHSDLCEDELLERFLAEHIDTPMVTAHHGVLERSLSSISRQGFQNKPELPVLSGPSGKGFFSETFTWEDEPQVNLDSLNQLFAETPPPKAVIRCKGIVNTGQTHQAFHYSDGHISSAEEVSKQASRLVIIAWEDPDAKDWWARIQQQLATLGQQPVTGQ